jgi:hypothetical protein
MTAVTDSQGRYRIENVTPDKYTIMAGFSDAPVFYPGTSDIEKSATITTTPTTLLTNLDITLPPAQTTSAIRGRIAANNGQPVGGATLNLLRGNSGGSPGASSFLPARSYKPVTTGGDGTFEISDVVHGQYSLQARVAGASPLTKTVDVADGSVNLNFDFTITVISGRISWEDGSQFSDPAIGQIAISTTSNPNFVATTLVPVLNAGTFSSVIEPGDYRVYIRNLPVGYIVRSMTMGSIDLSKEVLHVTGDLPDTIQIRVARGLYPGARVRGKVLDAASGIPVIADRVELCCFTTGPFERLSATVPPAGIFDFPQVPPGHYTAELRRTGPQAAAVLLNPTIDVGDQDKTGVVLVSANQQMTSLTAAVTFEDGSNLPSSVPVTLTLSVTPGKTRGTPAAEATSVEMGRLQDGTFWTPFPIGVLYTLSVGSLPDGYRIKSVSRSGANSPVPTVTADGSYTYSGVAPGNISVVLQKTPTN